MLELTTLNPRQRYRDSCRIISINGFFQQLFYCPSWYSSRPRVIERRTPCPAFRTSRTPSPFSVVQVQRRLNRIILRHRELSYVLTPDPKTEGQDSALSAHLKRQQTTETVQADTPAYAGRTPFPVIPWSLYDHGDDSGDELL